jgi:hypothetical protein
MTLMIMLMMLMEFQKPAAAAGGKFAPGELSLIIDAVQPTPRDATLAEV